MAAVDYFLKLEGVEGESQDAKHKKEIDIKSWTWGAINSGSDDSLGGLGSGRVAAGDFNFTKKADKASPKLILACCTGEHFNKATLICRKAGKEQQEYLQWVFTKVRICSVQTGGSDGEIVPMEHYSMRYAQFEVQYKEQKPDGALGGPIAAGYNLTTNAKV